MWPYDQGDAIARHTCADCPIDYPDCTGRDESCSCQRDHADDEEWGQP